MSQLIPRSQEIRFPTQYSQPFLTQCIACLWKVGNITGPIGGMHLTMLGEFLDNSNFIAIWIFILGTWFKYVSGIALIFPLYLIGFKLQPLSFGSTMKTLLTLMKAQVARKEYVHLIFTGNTFFFSSQFERWK